MTLSTTIEIAHLNLRISGGDEPSGVDQVQRPAPHAQRALAGVVGNLKDADAHR